ncbi:MAG: TetR/AcrR family transcriptional repressor of nem operon [Salibacteraceae bacterium]
MVYFIYLCRVKTKAEITSEFIIKTVAPVFNKKGYSGTSMSDITHATGLTKGAIYGNFTDKNELAVKSFVYTINKVAQKIEDSISVHQSSLAQLYAISAFYRDYYQFTFDFGGCPILNIGIDANHQNPDLLAKVKKAIKNLQNNMSTIIDRGIENQEIKPTVDSKLYARRIFSMIEGGIFVATMLNDKSYMEDLTVTIDHLIDQELKN